MVSLLRLLIIVLILHFLLPQTSRARTPQSCYWGANKLAPDDFLPCYGPTTTAQYSCCQAGDKCLEGNACYDSNTGVTYQYGCTDPTFKDPHCPQKCNLDSAKSHWVGLIFCNGSYGLPNNTWVCHHPDNCGDRGSCSSQIWGDALQRQPPTGCEDVRHGREYVALETMGTISDLVPLPAPSQTASWWSANADRYKSVTASATIPAATWTTLATMTSLRSTNSAAKSSLTSAPSTPIATEPPQSAPSNTTSSLRLGVSIGIVIPVILIVFLILYIKQDDRKRRKSAAEDGKHQNTRTPDEKPATEKMSDWWIRVTHHPRWHAADIASKLCRPFGRGVEAAKRAPQKAPQLWRKCMEKVGRAKDALFKREREEEEHAAHDYESKLELDSSPVPESTESPAASEMLDLPPPRPLRMVNEPASPTSSVRGRTSVWWTD